MLKEGVGLEELNEFVLSNFVQQVLRVRFCVISRLVYISKPLLAPANEQHMQLICIYKYYSRNTTCTSECRKRKMDLEN